MQILVITRGAWRSDNNIGNTFENIFSDFDKCVFFGLALRNDQPQNSIAKKNFAISEAQIIQNLLKKKPVGKYMDNSDEAQNDGIEKKMYTAAKKNDLQILKFAREILWSMLSLPDSNINTFLDDAKPDIIFMPVFGCWYPHKILKYIHKYTGAKVVLYHADDNYTLRQFSLSPLYWIYRLRLRKWVRKSVEMSDLNYAISDIQAREYEEAFGKPFKVLYKGYDFDDEPEYAEHDGVIKFVFTGNVSSGRYKTLSEIGKVINSINSEKKRAELDIYTLTPLSGKMKKALDIGGINLKGGISASEVVKIQRAADVLVHVESFGFKDKLVVRQSFSTKIVDYFAMAKCVLAVGPEDVASIDYLKSNDAAIVASDAAELGNALRMIVSDRAVLREYGGKAWECGKRNHRIGDIRKMLTDDFKALTETD